MQLVQELYHLRGQRFTSMGEVQQNVSNIGERWSLKLVPAICHLAKETGKDKPASDLPNGEHVFLYMSLYLHI